MKTAEEYLSYIVREELIQAGLNPIPIEEAREKPAYSIYISAIQQAQKDAYNQALEDAAEAAECEWDGQEHIEKVWIDKESILKLKK